MDDKKYNSSITMNKVTRGEIKKFFDALNDSDIDRTNVSFYILERVEEAKTDIGEVDGRLYNSDPFEEKKSIRDIFDELCDENIDASTDEKQYYASITISKATKGEIQKFFDYVSASLKEQNR